MEQPKTMNDMQWTCAPEFPFVEGFYYCYHFCPHHSRTLVGDHPVENREAHANIMDLLRNNTLKCRECE